jgi:TonB-linked SusC/RagA family outer membrane protein
MAAIALLAMIGFSMVPQKASAQSTINVSGVVTDEKGEPIIGAGILQIGTSVGTITGLDGDFKLTANRGATLRVSYLGYKTVEVKADNVIINITLEEDLLSLDEVVVIGYGTQRKADITSSVSSVKAEDFITGYVGDAAQLVKGKVPGLSVTKGNGDPKSSSTIMLRGVTSLMGGYTPLILVDGIEGSLETVAPESIEEISVLKDASAAAIYGTRGASGVILITTKTGKRGEHHSVSYSGYASASNFSKIDFMDADFIRDLIANDQAEFSAFGDLGATTDWLGLVSRTGFTQNHNLALEGGTQNMAYSANITWNDDNGVMKGSYSNDLRVQMDITQYLFGDMVKLNMNLLKSLSKSDNQDSYTIYHQAVIRNPTMPVYRENGDYYEQSAPLYYYNPIPYINEHEGGSRSESTRMTGNITVTPLTGWETNLQLSRRSNNGLNEYYNTPLYQGNRWGGVNGSAGKSQSDFVQDMLEITSRYEQDWDRHHFSGMLGYSWMESTSTGFGASNSEFPTDAYLYNALERGKYAELLYSDPEDKSTAYLKTYGGVSSYKNESRLIGFFGRISYGYDNRYNVLVSFRREGSTKFGADHKWGNFPAI